MMKPTIYEFEHAVRFNGKPGVTSIRSVDCEQVSETDDSFYFWAQNGDITRVFKANIHYILGEQLGKPIANAPSEPKAKPKKNNT